MNFRIRLLVPDGKKPCVGDVVSTPIDEGRSWLDLGTFVSGELGPDGVEMVLEINPELSPEDVSH